MWNKIKNFFRRNPGKTAVLSGAGATAIVATIATVPLSGPALAGAAVASTALAYVSGKSGWKYINNENLSVEIAEQVEKGALLNADNQIKEKEKKSEYQILREEIKECKTTINTQAERINNLEAKVNENKRSDAVEKVQIYNRIGTVHRLASQNRASTALQAHGFLAAAPPANDNEVVEQPQQPVRGVRR